VGTSAGVAVSSVSISYGESYGTIEQNVPSQTSFAWGILAGVIIIFSKLSFQCVNFFTTCLNTNIF